jgi:hypothetical protein
MTDPANGVMFAQSPPEETMIAAYMGYGPVIEPIPAEHASRTFDWATDDGWNWAYQTDVSQQVWHIVDGIVTEYMECRP